MALTKLNNQSLSAVTSAGLPSGTVLQVQSATLTTITTMSGNSYADVSGMSVSITPSSTSSKILVLVNMHVNPANSMGVVWKLLRNTTDIAVNNASNISTGGAYCDTGGSAGNSWNGNSISHLDSPSTTSSVTYKVQARGTTTSSFGINRRSNYSGDFGGASSITVMEIAG